VVVEIQLQPPFAHLRLDLAFPPTLRIHQTRRSGGLSGCGIYRSVRACNVIPMRREHYVVQTVLNHPIQSLYYQTKWFSAEELIAAVPELRMHPYLSDVYVDALVPRHELTVGAKTAELASSEASKEFEGAVSDT
jgi:hypothetical protein